MAEERDGRDPILPVDTLPDDAEELSPEEEPFGNERSGSAVEVRPEDVLAVEELQAIERQRSGEVFTAEDFGVEGPGESEPRDLSFSIRGLLPLKIESTRSPGRGDTTTRDETLRDPTLRDPTLRDVTARDLTEREATRPTPASTAVDLVLDEPALDLTLDELALPDAWGEITDVQGFTERTVAEAVEPREDESIAWEERLRQLERQLKRAATSSERVALLLEIGTVNWERLDDRGAAAQAFEEALALEPANTAAFEALDNIYYLEWETEKLAELLIDRAGHVGEAQQALLLGRVAELYLQLDQKDKAVIALEAAHRANPGDMEIATRLAELTTPPEPTQPKDQLELLAAQLEQVEEDARRVEIFERMAAIHQQRDQLDRMAHWLEQALALDPRRLACHRRLEQHYQQGGQLEQLADVLGRHAAVAPPEERLSIHHRLAKLLEGPLADPVRAREAYRTILSLDRTHAQALSAVARLDQALEDWPQAARSLEALVQRESNPAARADLLYRLACIQLDELGDREAGEAQLARALEAAPTHAKGLARLTEAYRARGDWGKVVRVLLQAEAASASPLEQARLLHAAGLASLEGLEDEDRAAELFRRTLEVDPDHAHAAAPLSQILWKKGLHEENLPVLELLLRKTDPNDRSTVAQIQSRLGAAAEAAGRSDKALRHLQEAARLDPGHLPTLRHLTEFALRKHDWAEARTHGAKVLERRSELKREELVRLLHGMGIALRELGDRDGAIRHLEQVLQVDPRHEKATKVLAELHHAAGNWEAVLQHKKTALERAEDREERLRIQREIAEVEWRQLNRPDLAEASLRRALELGPDDHGTIHDLIDVYAQMGRWDRTLAMCERMAELESEPGVRAKYFRTMAVIYRDKMNDVDNAVRHFNKVLDADAARLEAFEAIDQLCTQNRAWKLLEQSYGRMIKRLPQEGHVPLKVMLWHNLGEVLRSRRRDFESAAAAFEAAARLDPDNAERQRILGELYLSLGGKYARQAARALHELLRREPGRIDHYKNLRRLYMDGGRYDRAWSLCMVLSFIKRADREEEGFYQQYRRQRLRQAASMLTDDLWQDNVYHPDQNPYISAIFALVTPALASMTARPAAHYGLKAKDRRDPSRVDLPCLQVFDYVTAVLMVTRPELYLRSDRPEALMMAHTPNMPSFVAGSRLLQSRDEKELAFIIGKQLTYLRPENFLRNALPSRGQLQTVLLAVLSMCQPGFTLPEEHAKAVEPIIERIQRHLQPGSKEQLVTFVHRFCSGGPAQPEVSIARWWNGLDLSTDRVGFLLCNDLELAARLIHTEAGTSELSAKERTNQLINYATSEAYLSLREQLGLTIGDR